MDEIEVVSILGGTMGNHARCSVLWRYVLSRCRHGSVIEMIIKPLDCPVTEYSVAKFGTCLCPVTEYSVGRDAVGNFKQSFQPENENILFQNYAHLVDKGTKFTTKIIFVYLS